MSSNPLKKIGKAFKKVAKSVVKVVKKAWWVIVIAAAVYFTAGAATPAVAGAAGGSAGATVGGAIGTEAAIGGATGASLGATAGSGVAAGAGSTTALTGAASAAPALAAGPSAGYAVPGATSLATGSPLAASQTAATAATGASGAGNTGMWANPEAQDVGINSISDATTELAATNPGATPSQVGKVTDAATVNAGGNSPVAQANAQAVSPINGPVESKASLFKNPVEWAQEHPELAKWGGNAAMLYAQGAAERAAQEEERVWPGAYYGMTADGKTAPGGQGSGMSGDINKVMTPRKPRAPLVANQPSGTNRLAKPYKDAALQQPGVQTARRANTVAKDLRKRARDTDFTTRPLIS